MILKNTKLRKSIRKIAQKALEIEDILLFGSSIRGKDKPNDIDIMVIFKNNINKDIEYELRKKIEEFYNNISIISKTRKTSVDETFDARESILFEGTSLLSGKNLAKEYGFDRFGMFKYNFKGWDKLKKTKFYYALNGRGSSKGIFHELNCIKLSDNIILVNLENIEKLKEFLDSWEIEYKYIPMIIPNRLSKKKILES